MAPDCPKTDDGFCRVCCEGVAEGKAFWSMAGVRGGSFCVFATHQQDLTVSPFILSNQRTLR